MTRHPVLVVLLALVLVAVVRACIPVPAGGSTRVYLPDIGAGPEPTCDYRRDWWPCVAATLTREAAVSPTFTPTFRPWASRTPTPSPLALRVLGGEVGGGSGRLCSAAAAGGGHFWLAAHCLTAAPWRLRVDGVPVTAWQPDTVRDLAQVQAGDQGAAPVLAVLAPGDPLELRPSRGPVPAVFAEDAWGRHVGGLYELATWPLDGGFVVGVACVAGPGRVVWGDSGGGVHRTVDGALGGVIVAAEEHPPDGDVWCGSRQSVVIVRVP